MPSAEDNEPASQYTNIRCFKLYTARSSSCFCFRTVPARIQASPAVRGSPAHHENADIARASTCRVKGPVSSWPLCRSYLFDCRLKVAIRFGSGDMCFNNI